MLAAETQLLKNFQILDNIEYPVYSTGSRFFGYFRDCSDWDFMVDERAKDELLSLGYSLIEDPVYADGTTTLVLGKDNFHVQLYKEDDLKIMIAIRNAIRSNTYMYHLYLKLDKKDRKMFWKGLLSLEKNLFNVEK